MVDVVLGLLRPQSGAVVVDGVPVADEAVRGWQKSIGYVPQHIFLTDDTVTANIAFGVRPKDVDVAAVERAARIAELHDFVLRELRFASLADAVGVVSQETYLFHASVRENLRFARPDATDEAIEEAARAAQIHDTIAALPDGYDTVVGERGFRFSGGERQRIAIARTILRNPPVLVLDEATSALDVQTERAVGDALERLAEGRTTIVIAHRLSTVRDADQIAVLDAGSVVERGTHEELLAAGGRYAELVARDDGVAMFG
jgi:ABC-type multidrug transport system fused ATPase/permease subunit